jgi:hypothetical protein
MCKNSEAQAQKILELEQRIAQLEAVVFPQMNQPVTVGQRQIPSNPNRVETGMGPLLNSNSEFL